MGRVRTEDRNASRPIDIDIVLFDDVQLDPDLDNRVYRALPVSELLPEFPTCTGETLQQVARRLASSFPIRVRPDISIKLQERN
jgi:7,8-dihydro-6-hydroxymethylpterin-pyrophosphokinase